MAGTTYSIESFKVGDYAVFERKFTPQDREAFRDLSGDASELHNDAAYAAATPFGQIVVPLQLTLAPLSKIAGMVFPGEPALCLTLEVRAAGAVFYGEKLRYSARIEAINLSHEVLSLRILVLRKSEVVLDASMRVQARMPEWSRPPALPIRNSAGPSTALVTGSSGHIGAAIALGLAKQGWQLLLQDRGGDAKRQPLKEALARMGAPAEFVTADLADPAGRSTLAQAVAKATELGLIVHTASPPIDAPLADLAAVNFTALADVVDAALPAFLDRQQAAVVVIGPDESEHATRGWEAYAGAKAMTAAFVNRLDRDYAAYGIRGLHLLSDTIATPFSADYRGTAPALMPQEVAEAALELIADRQAPANTVRVDLSGVRRGRFGFYEPTRSDRVAACAKERLEGPTVVVEASSSDGHSPAAPLVRKLLRLPPTADLNDAALGVTPGWDSLKQIELLVTLESALGIRFLSSEMESLHRFIDLDSLCRKKLAERRSR
jgi:NAD(P)-dependent dehydrogenase (short-subunit alcohol dehydrogenase family)/acyl dehydratase/acyl carrier protein